MNQVHKKEREKQVLSKVKEIWSKFPTGDIVDEDPPDFILTTPEGIKIGIELTTYYQTHDHDGVLWVEQEGLRNKLCNLVESKLTHIAFIPTKIFLHFRNNPLSKKILPSLAEEIIQTVIQNDERIPISEVLSIDIPYSSQVRIVKLMRSPVITSHSCKPITSGWVPMINSKHIQDEISRKDLKVPPDKYECDELVLIIEIRGDNVASYSDLDEGIFTNLFRTTYDKCILFYDGTNVIELASA